MADQLRAAEKNIRGVMANGPPYEANGVDLWRLAKAYCDEHPIDDNEPIELGTVLAHNGIRVEYRISGVGKTSFAMQGPTCEWIEFREWENNECATRGDVRLLCAAMGISIKDTQ